MRTLQSTGADIAEREGVILGRIQEQDGVVVIDSRGCESRSLCDGYQAFGVLCAAGKVRAALVRTGSEDAAGHYTLRDILVTLARIAGIAPRFRLAFVAHSEAIVEVCRDLQRELTPLGCELAIFQTERQAFEWLRSGRLPACAPRAERVDAGQAVVQ